MQDWLVINVILTLNSSTPPEKGLLLMQAAYFFLTKNKLPLGFFPSIIELLEVRLIIRSF